jgi:hypothetical protein
MSVPCKSLIREHLRHQVLREIRVAEEDRGFVSGFCQEKTV